MGRNEIGDRDILARLVAENEIRNPLGRLAHLADDGDLEEYSALFTEDATWGHADLHDRRSGRADIRAGAEERRRAGIQGPGSGTRHITTTLWVAVETPDSATAESYYLYLLTRPDGPVVSRTGRYVDSFRRADQGWKLASRILQDEIN